MTTNLLVADEARTDKTICLSVSASLKSFGVPGRPRLFQAKSQVKLVNAERARKVLGRELTAKSVDIGELNEDPSLAQSILSSQGPGWRIT